MILYLIRHGCPDYKLDVLTKEGREQAEKTSLFLAKENIDTFFVSSAGRAKETAKRTLEKVGKEAKVVDWMREGYLAPYTSRFYEDGTNQWYFMLDEFIEKFKELDNDKNWFNDALIKTTELKKAVDMEDKNVDDFFLSIGIKHDRENKTYTKIGDNVPEKVAIFAHGAMAYAFLSSILDMTYPHFANTHKCLDVCGIAQYRINFDKPNSVEELNFNLIKY